MNFGLSEERFEERKQDLINATNRLKEALDEEENELMIDAVLHRYEFTFELAYNEIKNEYINQIQKLIETLEKKDK